MRTYQSKRDDGIDGKDDLFILHPSSLILAKEEPPWP
jgi:hypothetical protein